MTDLDDSLLMTQHAEIRSQQRGLSAVQIELLLAWGVEIAAGVGRNGEACRIVELDHRGLKKARSFLGKDGAALLDRLRNVRLVMRGGKVVTVMHRLKKTKEKCRPWREARSAA